MSTIYISEPPTNGKVIITTSCGEIEIELWSKEAPLACRNFVQLCMEGYYDNTIFHRVVKKFIIQGGDPDGTGEGGESIYGKSFKKEIHTRLRFNRRGLVAMHCIDGEVNGSQFFFTLSQTPELQNNFTIFGTVVGNTVFNMLNLAEGLINKETERPHDPKLILSTKVIVNPFDDIVPRELIIQEEPKVETPAVNDFGLLSFQDDMDDDGDFDNKFRSKNKSAHDYAKHSNLSIETVSIDPNETHVYKSLEIDLAPAIIVDSLETEEKKRKMKEVRTENRRLEKELANERLRDIVNERKEAEEEIQQTEIEMKKDPLIILKTFADKLKNSTSSDWFYNTVTGAENDEVEAKVYDPEVYNPEKYDLFDPRNPLNQRKRQADEPATGAKPTKEKK